MKLIIDIPEMAYEAFKEWHKNKVATVEQSIIANGTPYEPRPHGECRDRLKEVFREASEISGDLFHLYQIERIIDGEDWL